MRRGPTWILAVVLAVACGCSASLTYKEPPVGSYAAGARQVKIGEAVISVQAATVTLDFFRAAEVPPLIGRFFVEGEQTSSAKRVVVLSHDLWTERFASSPNAIGREIELDGLRTVVVGIAPPGFKFPDGTLLWTPKYSDAP